MSEPSLDEFKKIIDDFTRDLTCSYPEMKDQFESLDYKIWYDYCSDLYPENFFHILYENKELFDDDQSKFLLPEIDFKKIMEDETLSDSSKKTIWKYTQLVLFCVCNKEHIIFRSFCSLKMDDDFHCKTVYLIKFILFFFI